MHIHRALLALALAFFAAAAIASDIGQIKTSKGSVTIERAGAALPGGVGERLQIGDVVKTGADGSVGITMTDNSRLAAGPNSVLALDRYAFNGTTHEGQMETSLRRGTLSVVSGKIAKENPSAMTVRTPNTILGVRGTEFVVKVED